MVPQLLKHVLLALAVSRAYADLTTGVPDSAPAGYEEWTSPIVVPAPDVKGSADWAPFVARARKFTAQLTIEEKVNVTTGVDVNGRCVGNTGTLPRFKWAGLCLEDSPLGVRFADFASAFPASINAAATWDVDLIKARGVAMAQEHRGKGVNVALGPMTNLGRQAAAGRQWEGFGSDPFLAGVATAVTIEGMQSVGVIATVKHFIANEQEHFRGGSESFPIASSNLDDKTMHEVYLWPFAEAVKVGVGSVMCSYNLVNQTQACQNSKLINGILKEELGFQGFIMSDWAAMINGVQPALAGLDMNMPGFVGYGIGDQNQPDPSKATNSWWGVELINMIRNGSVPESRIDDMVTRIFATWYKLGQDRGYPEVSFSQLTQDTYLNGELVNKHINVQADHYKLIRQIGAASTVLLKNTKNALPLSVRKLKRVGIFGSDAAPHPAGPNACSDGQNDKGCNEGTLAMGWGSGTANFPYLVDPFAAISAHIRSINPTVVVEGVLSDYAYNAMAPVARNSDACLVFVNADSGEGYINVGGNQGDRNNITLWHGGEALIANVAGQCANTIVVQHAVGAVTVEDWIDHPNVTAVLQAGLPGQESGNAIVDVLFSDSPQATNPSAKLVYTIAKKREDYAAEVLYTNNVPNNGNPQLTYDEGVNIDYRWFDVKGIKPRFEFGFGLSYTTFGYSGLRVSGHKRRAEAVSRPSSSSAPVISSKPSASPVSSAPAVSSRPANASSIAVSVSASASASSSVRPSSTASAPSAGSSPVGDIGGPAALYAPFGSVSFTLKNTGRVAGAEVAQLYLTFPAAYNEPPRLLRGFSRVFLGAGQSKGVSIPLRVKDLSVWDVVAQKWVLVKGEVGVAVGASSRDIRLTGKMQL
ncbi:Fn3-like domain-containing protein [Mycena indigotica]|uniref:beta-glucosidase n=1 Tax=Mycena indigotica TaxID=2126181 RepID=A0A8H6VVW3_9AGAR|nr:Fn3-like domain-containing protein [Mycena indigotica]KAF7290169.1 Fn3-like domain-containing protein [Mycena indigotica]